MARRAFDVRAQLTPEAKVRVAKLRHTNLMPVFRREMKAAAAPAVPAVRQAARDTPSKRTRYRTPGGSLRSAVASSIQQKTRLSARSTTIIIKAVPKGGKSNLASVLEGTKPWEHPTYGHRPEVTQPSHPFFYRTLDKLQFGITHRISNVLSKFERML